MKKLSKMLCLLPAAVLAAGLSACGELPPEAGVYIMRAVYDGEGGMQAVEDSSAEIVLDTGGRGLFRFGDREGQILWSLSGDELEIKAGEDVYEGSLDGGLIKLDTAGGSTGFYREDRELPPQFVLPDVEREYYGWWRISDSEGVMPETWVDCCADISGDRFIIWDEDGSREKPFGDIRLRYDEDGALISAGGSFWYTGTGDGELCFDGDESGLLKLSGTAEDADGGSFSYEIYMRPWGERWEYEEEEDPELLPYHYERFYLALTEAGEEMPDDFSSLENLHLP